MTNIGISDILLNSIKSDISEEDNTNGIYYFAWAKNGDKTQCRIKRTRKEVTADGVIYYNEYIDGSDDFIFDWANRKSLDLNWTLKR